MKPYISVLLAATISLSVVGDEPFVRYESSANRDAMIKGWAPAYRGQFKVKVDDSGNRSLAIPKISSDRLMIDSAIYNNFYSTGKMAPAYLIGQHLFTQTYKTTRDLRTSKKAATNFIANYANALKEGRHNQKGSLGTGQFLAKNLIPMSQRALADAKVGNSAESALELTRVIIGQNAYDLEKEQEAMTSVLSAEQAYLKFANLNFATSMEDYYTLSEKNPNFQEAYYSVFGEASRIDPAMALSDNKILDPVLRQALVLNQLEGALGQDGSLQITADTAQKIVRRLDAEARSEQFAELSARDRQTRVAAMQTSLRTATLFTSVLADRESAEKLDGVGQGIIGVYTTIADYRSRMNQANKLLAGANKLSTTADRVRAIQNADSIKLNAGIELIGGLTNVASLLLNIFSSGPSIDELILQEVRQLSSDVHSMRIEFRENFAHLDRRFDSLFNAMADGFAMVSEGFEVTQRQLHEIELQVMQIQNQVLRLDNALAEYAFDSTVLRQTESIQKCLGADELISVNLYRECVGQFKVLAENYAVSAPIAGVGANAVHNQGPLEQWSGLVFFEALALKLNDLFNVNAASQTARLVVESAESRYGLNRSTIANPTEWSTVSESFATFVNNHLDLVPQDPDFLQVKLAGARRVGELTQSAIHRLTLPIKTDKNDGPSLSPLRLALADYEHALKRVADVAQQEKKAWEEENIGGHSINGPNLEPKYQSKVFRDEALRPCPSLLRPGVNFPVFNNALTPQIREQLVPKTALVAAEMKAVNLSICYEDANWTETESRVSFSEGRRAVHEELSSSLLWKIVVTAELGSAERTETRVIARRNYVSKERFTHWLKVWKGVQSETSVDRDGRLKPGDQALRDATASAKRNRGEAARATAPHDWTLLPSGKVKLTYFEFGGSVPNRDGVVGAPDWETKDYRLESTRRNSWIEHALHRSWEELNAETLTGDRFHQLTRDSLGEEERTASAEWLERSVLEQTQLARRQFDNFLLEGLTSGRGTGIAQAVRALHGAAHFTRTLVTLAYPRSVSEDAELHRLIYGDRQLLDRDGIMTGLTSQVDAGSVQKTLDEARVSILKPAHENLAQLDTRLRELESRPRTEEVLPKIRAGLEALSFAEATIGEMQQRIPLEETISLIRARMSALK